MSEQFIHFNGQDYATDVQGFLKKRLAWSAELGTYMAKKPLVTKMPIVDICCICFLKGQQRQQVSLPVCQNQKIVNRASIYA